MTFVEMLGVHQRAQLGLRVERVADFDVAHALIERGHETRLDAALYQ